MKHFGYGCGMVVGGWLLVGLVIAFGLDQAYGIRLPDTLGVAAGAGLLGWAGLGLLFSAAVTLRERFAVHAAMDGAAPRDGAGAVAIGAVQGQGAPLQAPFSGEDCFAYDYRVIHDNGKSGKQRSITTVFEGRALAPCTIACGTGYFRLLGVPDLDRRTTRSSGITLSAAQDYVAATTFLPDKEHVAELTRRWDDADGSYRADIGRAPRDGLAWHRCTLEQHVLRPRAMVCVIGHFSTQHRGFVPAPSWGRNIMIYQCSGAELLQVLVRSALWRLVIGLVLIAAATGLVLAFAVDHT